MFGEAAVFASVPRTASVEAIGKVVVAVLHREDLAGDGKLDGWLATLIRTLAERFVEKDRLVRQDERGSE